MRSDKVKFYRDAEGLWRWRYVASNGRILADSGQGYVKRADAIHGWRTISDRDVAIEVER